MIETLDTIYKRTSTGAVQIWYGELDGEGRYRTVSGQQHGTHTTSEWTMAEAKNEGRANATTAIEQARLELESKYRDRLSKDYFESIADIDKVRFVEPMLADKWKDRKAAILRGTLLFIQPKLDGYRATIARSPGSPYGIALLSRNGKPYGGAQHLLRKLAPLFERNPKLILDGEMYNHDHKDQFEELGSAIKKEAKTPELRERAERIVQFHVYDIPSEATANYGVRLAALQELFANEPELQDDSFHLVETESVIWNPDNTSEFDDFMSSVLERGYEGGIVRLNTPYEFKRTKSLLKVKEFIDGEFEIVGIEEGKGNWAGCAKRYYIAVPGAPVSHGDRIINHDTGAIEKFDGTQTDYERCSKATPKGTMEYCRDIFNNKDKYIGKFGTLTFFRYTVYGVPYLPIMKGIRVDDPRNN
jgi:DNA ligase-1